jgi:hypothetical protein
VVVSVVWVIRGGFSGQRVLDGTPVPKITAFLFHGGGDDNPAVLLANRNKSFIGSFLRGMGFTFDDTTPDGASSPLSEMERLIAKDPRNAERIFPYLGGEEVNSSPTHAHHRYVINFGDYPFRRRELGARWNEATEVQQKEWLREGVVPLDYPGPVATDWPDLLCVVGRKVRPERKRLGNSSADAPHKKFWWRFANTRPVLYNAITPLERVLVRSRIGNAFGFSFVSARIVLNEKVVVFPFDKANAMSVIHSRVHELWAVSFSSTLKDDLQYTPSDCFETFPFPMDWETDAALERVGREYYEYRAGLMVERGEGLTKTYNHFHDPEKNDPGTVRLRELHGAMDAAVLRAYGWGDLVDAGLTECDFVPDYYEEPAEGGDPVPKSVRYRWSDATRDEVLARLLALNAERAAEEGRGGSRSTSKA